MNRDWVLFHLQEAEEELRRTISELQSTDDYGFGEFSVAMTHAYHHLDTRHDQLMRGFIAENKLRWKKTSSVGDSFQRTSISGPNLQVGTKERGAARDVAAIDVERVQVLRGREERERIRVWDQAAGTSCSLGMARFKIADSAPRYLSGGCASTLTNASAVAR